MALEESTNTVMPVAPMGYGNGGFGGFGGDGWWIVLLLLFGWGGMGGMGMNGMYGGMGLYPWMNQADITTSGFQNAATNSAISTLQSAVTSGFGDLQTALCGGFAGVNAGIANGFAQAEIAANARQISDLQQQFALQSQMAQCCCDNRLATANLQSVIQSENCADRAAISDGIRDLLTATNAQTQRILDQMCNDKIDAKNDTIAQLRQELLYARGQASQGAQTASILADNAAQTAALEQYLAPVPRPAYIVQNPNCCANNGCGCGCTGV